MSTVPLLTMRGISKRFPGVIALDGVSIEVGKGEVVALCGENGAGKSTLMKILGGVYQPDGGEILIDGQSVKISNVTDAMKHGIAFIHQELNILDNLDVAANVFLGREPRNAVGLINSKKIHSDTAPLLKRLGLDVSSRTRLDRLPLAQQQMVEIAKALSLNSRLIIMDEPTSSLTLQETDRLLELVCELSAQGVSVIYISHRLGEVEHCADRVVVLRDGKNAGELPQAEVSHERIVSLMVGREIKSSYTTSKAAKTPAFFKVRKAHSSRYPGKTVELTRPAGKSSDLPDLSGPVGRRSSRPSSAWMVEVVRRFRSANSAWPSPRPPTRLRMGFFSCPKTVAVKVWSPACPCARIRRYPRWKGIPRSSSSAVSVNARSPTEQIASLKIKTPGGEALVVNLSGGNQQKVVLGKWLSMSPKVMILDERRAALMSARSQRFTGSCGTRRTRRRDSYDQ